MMYRNINIQTMYIYMSKTIYFQAKCKLLLYHKVNNGNTRDQNVKKLLFKYILSIDLF